MNEPTDLRALVEELRTEQREKWYGGERLLVESLLARHPRLAENSEAVLDLVYCEILLREGLDDKCELTEYVRRFPGLADQLPPLFAVHDAVGDGTLAGSFADLFPAKVPRFPIRLNCPHCQNPIAIVDDAEHDEVICPSCGSSIRLDADRTTSWNPAKLPMLGKFKLLRSVGRGAFGTVYEARDTQLDRRVAVKVPRSGRFTTPQDEDRFIREARSAAQLRHPGIIPIYDVFRTDSIPVLVSEFVDGVTLADALTARQFSFRESAEIIAQAAEALDHAHRSSVVHRDVKPSNLMLVSGGDGAVARGSSGADTRGQDDPLVVRVMDFGLARRDEGEVTMTVDGQILGTPAYMSPQQAAGESHKVDGRSDVYSLGVIMYQLLVGELPFRGNNRMLLHQVLREEPRRPRSLNDRVPRDLETICLKCLEKDPARRYAAAQDLANDMRRYLRNEPIHARPIGRVHRAVRWARRKPLAASLVAALVIGIAGTSWQAIRATLAEQEASQALADVSAQKSRAESAEHTAQNHLGQLQKGFDILGAVFRNMGRPQSEQPDYLPQSEKSQREIFAERMKDAAVLLDSGAIDDALAAARLRHILGASLGELGYMDDAIPLLVKSHESYAAILGAEHNDTLSSTDNLTSVYKRLRRFSEALPLLKESLETRKTKLGPHHIDTLNNMHDLADAYRATNRIAEALSLREDTLKLVAAKFGPAHPDTLNRMDDLAHEYLEARRMPQAFAILEEVLKLRKSTLGHDHEATIASMYHLAYRYRDSGRLAEALPLFEEILKNKAKLERGTPQFMDIFNLATAYDDAGRPADAAPLLEEGIKLQLTLRGQQIDEMPKWIYRLVEVYRKDDRLAEALTFLGETLKLQKVKLGQDHHITLSTIDLLVTVAKDTGRFEQALPILEETLAYQRSRTRPGELYRDSATDRAFLEPMLKTMDHLTALYKGMGRRPQALALLEESYKLRKSNIGSSHVEKFNTMNDLATAYFDDKQPEKALHLLREGKAELRKQYEAIGLVPSFPNGLDEIGLNLLRHGQYAEAETVVRECLTIREKSKPDAWTTFYAKSVLGATLLGQQKYDQAEPLLIAGYEGMKARRNQIPLQGQASFVESAQRLVQLYEAWGKASEAARWRKEQRIVQPPRPPEP
jgi:serine/threonine protein kinase